MEHIYKLDFFGRTAEGGFRYPSGWRRCSQDTEYSGNTRRKSEERWRTPVTTAESARTRPSIRWSFVRRGRPPSYAATSDWREIGPHVSYENDAERATRVSHSSLLLRRSDARKEANREGEGENIPPLEGSCAALGRHRDRQVEEDLGSPQTCTTAQGIALRWLVLPNVRINLGMTPSDGRRRRSALTVIQRRSRGIPIERQADHREILVGKVWHWQIHKDFSTFKERKKKKARS